MNEIYVCRCCGFPALANPDVCNKCGASSWCIQYEDRKFDIGDIPNEGTGRQPVRAEGHGASVQSKRQKES